MRLHFYTGIAMSMMAAEYAAASSVEGETAVDTLSTAETWVEPYDEFSQVEADTMLEVEKKATKKAVKSSNKKSQKATKSAKSKAIKK